MHNLSCENEFYLRENEKWFPYQRLSTYPCFETEAPGELENGLLIIDVIFYIILLISIEIIEEVAI